MKDGDYEMVLENIDKYVVEFYNHSRKDFEDVFNIEANYFAEETIADVDQVISWDRKNSDIHIFVKDRSVNKVIGEITLLPLTDNQFIKFMNNELSDTELNDESLENYTNNYSYNLLFSAIAVDKAYRNDKLVLSCLLKGLYEKVSILIDRGIRIKNMCAEGQTKDGQKFAENFLNLKEQNTTKEGYKLYSFDSEEDFNKWFNLFPTYIKKYDASIKC